VELCFGQQSPSAVRRQDGEFVLEFPERDELRGDRLLVAIGRRARIHDIGLENVGIEPGRRGIEVDARMRAGDGIWATGDTSGAGRSHTSGSTRARPRAHAMAVSAFRVKSRALTTGRDSGAGWSWLE
jgi:pyruvate/2-oxoglutarate dehydrogenase complex dihydrolipoamide dehydrogenase (E3) component